jgi:predicted nicotinamide N-methyase
VLATDFHPHNEQFLRRNIELNHSALIDYLTLDWAAPPGHLQADLVIGSDLLYEARNIEPLVRCSAALCGPHGSIILADPGRKHVQSAVLRFREQGFQDELHVVDEIFIVALRRTAPAEGSVPVRAPG